MTLEDSPSPAPAPQPRMVTVKAPQVSPAVTYTLLALTILVFLLQMGSKFVFGGLDYPAGLGLKANDAILQGQLWRLFTPMFLHSSVSILHIGFNMYALYILGPELERHFGHSRFLALYLLSGFAGNVISFLFSAENSLGASTAIFGLIGAQGVFFYRNRGLFGNIARRVLINTLTVAAINLFIGLSPGIDNWGHVGGLVGGVLFTWFSGPVVGVETVMGEYRMKDQREPGSAFAAGLLVGLLFAGLASLKFFF